MSGADHFAATQFEAAARLKLLAEPRMASRDAPGDFAMNGFVLPPERIALLKPAAVLIAVNRNTGHVLFTERAKHLSRHPGQISFPGGRIDPTDDGPLAAALREAHEEIGMPPERVTPIGYLDEYFTGTGFRVTPVVALVEEGSLSINRDEVETVFTVPVDIMMDPGMLEEQFHSFEGVNRRTYAIRYENRYIWGVTAGIIRCLQLQVAA
jgi:8-oxo-dGTP pyrophosphatase MutT (NUDIX family)